MTKLKTSLCLICLLIAVGCQTTGLKEDTMPELQQEKTSGRGEVGEYIEPGEGTNPILMMEITIEYVSIPTAQRQAIRNDIASALAYTGYTACYGNADREIWVVPSMSATALSAAFSNITISNPDYDTQAGTANNGHTNTSLLSVLVMPRSGSATSNTAIAPPDPIMTIEPYFIVYLGNNCD